MGTEGRLRALYVSISVAFLSMFAFAAQIVLWASGSSLSSLVSTFAATAGIALWESLRLARTISVAEVRSHLGLGQVWAGLLGVVVAVGSIAPDVTELDQLGSLQNSLLAASGILVCLALSASWLERYRLVSRFIAMLGRAIENAPTVVAQQLPGARQPATRRERSFALIVITLAAVAFLVLVPRGPLGHDESVYAVKGRAWLAGTPDSGFGLYRPIGMAVAARIIFQFAEAEFALRIAATLISLGVIVLIWRFGRLLLSPAAGILAAALVASAPSFLRHVPEFLNDISSTAIVLAILMVLWQHFEGDGRNRMRIAVAAPLGAVGFYLRYGVASTLVVVAVVGAIVWRDRLRTSLQPLIVTTAATAVLVLPHVIYAQAKTGSIVGIMTLSTEAAGRSYVGEGLLTYARWLPDQLAGPLLGGVLMLGIASSCYTGALVVSNRRVDQRSRSTALLGGVGITNMVLSGVFVHAEQRYVFVSIILLALVGSQAAVDAVSRLVVPLRRTALAASILVLLAVLGVNTVRAHTTFDRLERTRDVIVAAGDVVNATTGGEDCTVMTSYVPQIAWYSRCAAVGFKLDALRNGGTAPTYLLIFENGKRQPSGAFLEEFIDAAGNPVPITVADLAGEIGDGRLYLVDTR